jgi:hypothetical protein
MMKRHNQILAAVLVLQIAVTVLVLWPRPARSEGESQPFFGDLQAQDIRAISISDTADQTTRLARADDGWVLSEIDDYPAQTESVEELLEKLLAIETNRLVTNTEASHRRLRVASDEFERCIDLETTSGDSYTLYLGSSPSYGLIHVRLEGQNETYQTDEVTSWEASASVASWIDNLYINIPTEDITSLTLKNANGEWEFYVDREGNWDLTGLGRTEELDTSAVTTLVNRAASLSILRPLGVEEQESYGLDEPLASVSIEANGDTHTFQIGAQDPDDNSYVVISSDSDYYVSVNQTIAEEFTQKTREDFLVIPPTPTPAPEADSASEEP